MTPRPVHWHEGMFLRPHHFQAADRHAARMLADNVATHPLARLGTGPLRHRPRSPRRLSPRRPRPRCPFPRRRHHQPPGRCAPPELDLKPAFADRTSLDVHIAIPKWRPGQPNLHSATATSPARYLAARCRSMMRTPASTRSRCRSARRTSASSSAMKTAGLRVAALVPAGEIRACRGDAAARRPGTFRRCWRATPGPPFRTASCSRSTSAWTRRSRCWRPRSCARHLVRQPLAGRCPAHRSSFAR